MFNAVSRKTKIHLAVMTEEYIRTTPSNLQMETMWEDVHALPGTLHIHCVKEYLSEKIKTSQFKNDECSIAHLLKHFSNENATPIQEKVIKHFAIGQYIIVKYEILFILDSCSKYHQERFLKYNSQWNEAVQNFESRQVVRICSNMLSSI